MKEEEFWSMTIAEIERELNAARKREQRRASYDYVLADLIGRSMARVHNSKNTYPTLAQAYPTLFDIEEEQEKQQTQKDSLSAIRFRQFANAHNNKMKGGK